MPHYNLAATRPVQQPVAGTELHAAEYVRPVERENQNSPAVAEDPADHRRGRGGCRGGIEEELQAVEHKLFTPRSGEEMVLPDDPVVGCQPCPARRVRDRGAPRPVRADEDRAERQPNL